MAFNFSIVLGPTSETPGELLQVGSTESEADMSMILSGYPAEAIYLNAYPPNQDPSRSLAMFILDGDGEVINFGWILRPVKPNAYDAWDYALNFWYDPRPIGDRRDAQWELIKAAQLDADAQDLEWSGSAFQVDAGSRDKIKEALLDSILATLASETWSIEWTLSNNSTLTMGAADMSAMSRALAARTNDNHDKAQTKRTLIYASSTPEDITWDSVP